MNSSPLDYTKLKDKRHQHSNLSDHKVGQGGDASLRAFIVNLDSFCPKFYSALLIERLAAQKVVK